MEEAHIKLWAAVLKQAIKDAQKYYGSFSGDRSQLWFKSETEEVGSFLWICNVLDLDPESIARFMYIPRQTG